MSYKMSYRGASTSHGGIVGTGVSHNVLVQVGGGLKEASLDNDLHICPAHGVNHVIAQGFAKFTNIKHTLVGDPCACGAVVVGESDNTFSDRE